MRYAIPVVAATLLSALSTGCGGGACSAEARVGLSVTLVDASTQQPLCDAQVTATRSDGMVVTLAPSPAGGCRYDQYESAGTWNVAVSAPGYTSASRTGIVVTGDGCHAVATPVTIALAPQ